MDDRVNNFSVFIFAKIKTLLKMRKSSMVYEFFVKKKCLMKRERGRGGFI